MHFIKTIDFSPKLIKGENLMLNLQSDGKWGRGGKRLKIE